MENTLVVCGCVSWIYSRPVYFVGDVPNYGSANPFSVSINNMVLPCHPINTTQPPTLSSPCFPGRVQKLQHITSNQPYEPSASSELSSPESTSSSELSTVAIAVLPAKRSPPITFLAWKHSHGGSLPGRSTLENKSQRLSWTERHARGRRRAIRS